MKKSLFFVAALALTFVACQPSGEVEDKVLGTFEEAAISPAAVGIDFAYKVDTAVYLKSGGFQLKQTVAYEGTYVTGAVVTNRTDVKVESYLDANKSCTGGAFAGNNYVVWYEDGFSGNDIVVSPVAKVSGMYVTNTAWVVKAIKEGDGMSPGKFEYEDYLLLTIHGWANEKEVGKVEFYLAKDNDYVSTWEYVDLSSLGVIDRLTFSMSGSKANEWGLTTPTYFCIDNLGAKK